MAGLLRTSNPALNERAFKGQVAVGDLMTLQGTVNKTGLLLLCVVATAAWTWGLSHSNTPEAVYPWMIGGFLGGFVVALVTIFKKTWSPFTAPMYALLEGLPRRRLRHLRENVSRCRHPGRRPHARHAVRNASRLQVQHDPRHPRFQDWRDRSHWRHRRF